MVKGSPDLGGLLTKVFGGRHRGPGPICRACLWIRNDEAYWQHVEGRLKPSPLADLCPNCCRTLDVH